MMKHTSRIFRWLPWLFPAAAFAILCIFVNARMDMLLDSDMSSEMILGKLLSEEGGILSTSWYYSSELRVLNTQLIFAPLFGLLNDWHAVRMAACVLLYAVLAAGLVALCRSAKLTRPLPWLLTILFLPFSSEYFYFVLYGLFYIPHICISFVYLALMLRSMKASERRTRLIYGVSGVLAFMSGLGGFRQLIILFIPLLISTWIIHRKEKSEASRKCLRCAAIGFGGSMAGLFINAAGLRLIFTFHQFFYMQYTLPSPGQFWKTLMDMLSTSGYNTGLIYSHSTMINAACLLLLLGIALAVWRGIKNELPGEQKQLALFVICAVSVFCILYTVTNMDYAPRYNLTLIVFFPLIFLFGIKSLRLKKWKELGLMGIVLMGLASSGFLVYYNVAHTDKTAEYREVASRMQEKAGDVKVGYASFWNANVLTELSNGEIEMRHWGKVDNDTISNPEHIYKWLQKTDNAAPVDGSFFLLLEKSQYEEVKAHPLLKEEDILFQTENYVVFVYENLTDYYGMTSSDGINDISNSPEARQ